MGEVKLLEKSPCKTVALRYRFVYKKLKNGEPVLRFQPHGVVKLQRQDSEDSQDTKLEDLIEEVDVRFLRSLDPKIWKEQDHYKVLGLNKIRHKCNDDVVKTAYRKIVLKHHPDKRKALGEEVRPSDDYFHCITMAYETLGTLSRRRAYDSVDPEFDDSLPSTAEIKEDFFKTFTKYFSLNSRWSEKAKVPKLGNSGTPRKDVENFYNFWYNFKSWREYSYEDEEDKNNCQDRDERRYVDKQNKAERLRKKKEEMTRIRSLVDMAYDNDPRIKKFKQDDKDRKEAVKRAKQTAAQAKKEEEERLLKEIQLAKEKADAVEREKIEALRQERDQQKRALRKEKKQFRDICRTNNYFASDSKDNLTHLQAVDKICEILRLPELEELNKGLRNEGRERFLSAMKEVEDRISKEKQKLLEASSKKSSTKIEKNVVKVNAEWTQDNIQLLIKAVNLFPAGTNQRWEVVANFINQHGSFADGSTKFNAKAVLAKAKDLQNADFSKNNLKEVVNKQAFDNFQKEKRNVLKVETAEISKNVQVNGSAKEVPEAQNGVKTELPWTAGEQQLLEQALKTYPASTAERWDRIAECLPNRSKKECMRRYKELVETVKAKKAAQAALAGK